MMPAFRVWPITLAFVVSHLTQVYVWTWVQSQCAVIGVTRFNRGVVNGHTGHRTILHFLSSHTYHQGPLDAPRGSCGTTVLPLKPGQPQATYVEEDCDVHFYGDDQLLDDPERSEAEERYLPLSHIC
jgi:hypothetical protein